MTKQYGNQIAANNLNIEVKRGEIYGLVGKNGAGKTTFLRMISGLSSPTSGEIELFDETSKEGLNKARMRSGSIIETPCFFPYLSARKNLEYYRIQRGIVEVNSVDFALEFVGLKNTGSKKFKNFSMGMKQRLGMALAIMASPDLLILDEPINGLDPEGIKEAREILLKLNRENGTTIIISSHILGELSQLATNYGFINKGELIEQVSSKELKKKCKKCLSIKVNNIEKASIIIEREFQCNKYEVLSGNEIRLYEKIDKPEIIAELLMKNGIKLFWMYEIGFNLEDYFISLIGIMQITVSPYGFNFPIIVILMVIDMINVEEYKNGTFFGVFAGIPLVIKFLSFFIGKGILRINDFLITGLITVMSDFKATSENMIYANVYGMIYIAIFVILGLVCFNKKDIK